MTETGQQFSGSTRSHDAGSRSSRPRRRDPRADLLLGRRRLHPSRTGYEFGPTGTTSSAFPGGSVAEMDFDQSSKRLFVLDKNETQDLLDPLRRPRRLTRAVGPALSR